MNSMQHQYWVTKKSVSRKFGGREDDCIVASDAELDAKLELFRSIADTCQHLQRVIDNYQERLCLLAQEENALGRYLKEYGKAERNTSAAQIMSTSGKALAYTGHQRLTVRPPLLRLHQEVETFRGRAVSDTRVTVGEMEKARTEYRAALSWMKSCSAELDPDTGHGLDKFRKAQSYVRSTKARFDRLMLASLQKVDLLAAARCNMFSHALVAYQNAIKSFSVRATDTLSVAAVKLANVQQPYDFCMVPELSAAGGGGGGDDCKKTFFNSEFSDRVAVEKEEKKDAKQSIEESTSIPGDQVSNTLLGENFEREIESVGKSEGETDQAPPPPSAALLDLNWTKGGDFAGGLFMPSNFLQHDNNLATLTADLQNTSNDRVERLEEERNGPSPTDKKTQSQVSWLSLFAELDPLANQDDSLLNLADRA